MAYGIKTERHQDIYMSGRDIHEVQYTWYEKIFLEKLCVKANDENNWMAFYNNCSATEVNKTYTLRKESGYLLHLHERSHIYARGKGQGRLVIVKAEKDADVKGLEEKCSLNTDPDFIYFKCHNKRDCDIRINISAFYYVCIDPEKVMKYSITVKEYLNETELHDINEFKLAESCTKNQC